MLRCVRGPTRMTVQTTFCALLCLLGGVFVAANNDPAASKTSGASEQPPAIKKQLGAPTALSRQFSDRVSKATMLLNRGNSEAAREEIEKILQRWPGHAPALIVKSKILAIQNNGLEARTAARAAIESDPNWKEGYTQLASLLLLHGKQLLFSGDSEGAYESFRQILLIDMDLKVLPAITLSQVHDGIAQALHAAGMPDVAIESLEKAISLHSKNVDALYRLAALLLRAPDADEDRAVAAMQRALQHRFDAAAWAQVLRWQMRQCDWSSRHEDLQRLAALLAAVSPHASCPLSPALALDFPLPAASLLACARSASDAAGRKHPPARNDSAALAAWRAFEPQRRLTVALLAGHPHAATSPSSRLLQAVPHLLDRRWFRVVCIELHANPAAPGALDADAVRRRIADGCDDGVLALPPEEEQAALAQLAPHLHVLLDLSGHDSEASLRAAAGLPAQLQVAWQGYYASRGAAFVPFLSSDAAATPPEMQHLCSERLLLSPPPFLLSSHAAAPAEAVPVWAASAADFAPPSASRRLFRLPEHAFLFAFFGDPAAIDPSLWMAWMEILRVAKRSCLWLLRTRAGVETNLHAHGLEYGIHSTRIIFSDPFPPHLETAAMGLADLFLDTRQRSAAPHTVFAALYATLPVLTLPGDALHRRTTASILQASGVGAVLVARTLDDYEAIAIRLARNPAGCQRLRERLLHTKESEEGMWALSTKVSQTGAQLRMLWDASMFEGASLKFNLVTATGARRPANTI